MALLEVKGLRVKVKGEEVVKGVDLSADKGEIVALMGPNGSGKTSFSFALMGHPAYRVGGGNIMLEGKKLNDLSPDERSRAGLFLSFQNPVEIPGVTVANFLRTSLNARLREPVSVGEFMKTLREKMRLLRIEDSFAGRYLNEGFSGGEKKKMEILQLVTLNPKVAILDEIDSGLDVDAMRIVANGINEASKQGMAVLVITHYKRLLDYVVPSRVYVMIGGRIVKMGSQDVVRRIEKEGFAWSRK